MLPYSFTLGESCSNNVAEYQALIIGLQMALDLGVVYLEAYGDSKLVINQVNCQYDVKHEDLKPYFIYATQLIGKFESVLLEHIPRLENKRADALANLATALANLDDEPVNIPLCQKWVIPPIENIREGVDATSIYAIEDWRQCIIDYLEHG